MTGAWQVFLTAASALSAVALNALWQDALLVLCVWIFLRAWPRINAATRYAVWSTTLVAAFVVPVATTLAFFAPPRQSEAAAARAVAPSSYALHAAPQRRSEMPERLGSTQSPRLPQRIHVTLPMRVTLGVFAAWALLAAYALARLVIGLTRLEQLKRDALPLPVAYRDSMPRWTAANKGRRSVRLCVSEEIDVPVAVGLFDAMILIPRPLLDRLSPVEVEQISLHELAHLRRGDDWSNCVQRLIIAALGWNPGALFIAAQLELEREVACDDWVLSFVGTVRPYALCLTKMAETAAWPQYPMPAPGVFTSRKQISLRIERLLGAGRDVATTLAIAPAAAAVAAVGAIALAITLVAPSVAAPSPAPVPPTAPVVMSKPKPAVPPTRIVYVAHVVKVPVLSRPPSTALRVTPTALRVAALPPRPFVIAQQSNGTSCTGCSYKGVNWAGRDLRGVKYLGVDFTAANLAGANLSGSSLNGVDFTKAALSGASFSNAHLNGVDFTRADLRNANFSGAQLVGVDFSHARLDGANLQGATLRYCDLSDVDLSHVDLSKTKLIDTDSPREETPP